MRRNYWVCFHHWQTRAMVLGMAGAVAVWPQQPSSAERLKQLSLEELSKLEITSVTKDAVPALKTPAAIFVLSSEEIRRSSARTLPDLLRLIPGVRVSQIDSSNWAIGIRGFQGKLSKSVLVLIDGRSVYTPLFAGVYWEMQDLLIDDIERIEVIRGPGGTIWGSNAVNGVINIITKDARDTRGQYLSAGGGNVDQGALNVRSGGGTDRTAYRVWGKAFTRAPQFHRDARNFDDWRRTQAGFRMDSRFRRDHFTLQGDVYGGEAGQRLQISSFSPPANPSVEGDRAFNGQNLMAAWQRSLNSGADVQVRAFFSRTDRRELNYREVRNTFDADFIHHAPLGRHDLTWGFGARTSPSHFRQIAPSVLFTPAEQTYNIFSAFLQDNVEVLPERLSISLGSKFEHTTFSGYNAQPSARLSYTPSERQILWAAVTRAVRTASRIEDGFTFNFLSQPSIPLFLRLIGDSQFQPETMMGYEAGYRNYVRKRGFVSLSLFHNRYNDLLSVESGAPFREDSPLPPHLVLPISFRNGVAANTSGGEFSSLWELRAWWRVQGSYSLMLLDAKRRPGSNDASTVRQLEGDTATHAVVAQSMFQLPKAIDFTMAFRYVSAIPSQSVPAYSTGDVRIAWRIKGPWEVEATGRNLLQPWHVEYGGNPGPLIGIRRSFYVGLIWRR